MCFKNKQYYVNKIKNFFDMVAVSIAFTIIFMFMLCMA